MPELGPISYCNLLLGSGTLEDCDEKQFVTNGDPVFDPPATSSTAADLSQAQNSKKAKKSKKSSVKWRQNRTGSMWTTPDWFGGLEPATSIKTPVEYFRMFFSSDLLKHVVDQSNLYSVQQNLSNLNLNCSELEQFIGSLLVMSLVKLCNSRKYWSGKLNCPLVTEVFSRDRWDQIEVMIHFNNNENLVTDKKHPDYDALFKVRPLIAHLAEKFQEIPKSQRLCVDERMIPFKGVSSLKQYFAIKTF